MRQALAGIRVVTIEDVLQLPWATMLLADLGAEVIRIESLSRVDSRRLRPFPENIVGREWWNESGWFHAYFRNKKSVTLDLRHPDGLALCKELIKVSDVVAENNRPGAMERLGLDYKTLWQLKPDIIMLRTSGYGQTGPWGQAGAFARTINPVCGLNDVTGFEEGPPLRLEDSFCDMSTGWNNALAILIALHHRRRTGEGAYIDVSMYETGITCIAPVLLGLQMNASEPGRIGNSHPYKSPHGCYRCKGVNEWVVVSVTTDAEWEALVRAMDQPPWATDERFRASLGRWRHRAELDRSIEAWTSTWERDEIVELLRSVDVPSGPVNSGRDVLTDSHLWQRGFLQGFTHPPRRSRVGRRAYVNPMAHLSRTPGDIRFVADLGEHNEEILGDLVGLGSSQIRDLERRGVIGTVPVDADLKRPDLPSLDQLVEHEQLSSYDRDYKRRVG